jgi:hypothetical protein
VHDLRIHYLICIHSFASLEMHVCVGDSLSRFPIRCEIGTRAAALV